MSNRKSKGGQEQGGGAAVADRPGGGMADIGAGAAAGRAARQRRRIDANGKSRQLGRIRRLGLIALFGAAYLLLLTEYHFRNVLGSGALGVIASMVAAALLSLYAVFLSGLNCRARDKNLTLPVALGVFAILLATIYLAPGARILYVPFSFIIVAYGMYRLSQLHMLLLTAVALVGYGLVIGLHWVRFPESGMSSLEALEWLTLAVTLPGFVLLTGRVRRLHGALYRAGLKIRNIEESARRDPLIGCYNRRYMIAALEEQKRIADDYGHPLCLAVIDLDHFKSINDSVGHLAGDEVLRTFACIAQDSVRQEDVFGRYGGEEFVLVLPGTPLLAALNTVERIRHEVETHNWQGRLQKAVTVSIGLTQYIAGEPVLDLFSRTDTAMYLAKRGGRNQVVVEEPSGELWHAADN